MRLKYEKLLEEAMKKIGKGVERKRFEIPEVIIQRLGQRTLVRNFAKIAEVFRREKTHLAKFLFKQLATIGEIKEDILYLRGKLSKEIVQRKVEEYAKNYVICKECKSADTKLIKRGRFHYLQCEACGARRPIK
jgi:translation initiation factor 2 subunit 2